MAPGQSQAMKPTSFRSQKLFRAWLAKNHATATELSMRLFKVHASHRGVGYREALDEALCWGWIDGIRHAYDADSFLTRFTPRKPKSYWSNVNIKRYKELLAAKRVMPPGRAAFKPGNKQPDKYSYEADIPLSPEILKRLKSNSAAWKYFTAQAPWYQRVCRRFVMNAVRAETREKRVALIVDYSSRGKPIPQLDRPKNK